MSDQAELPPIPSSVYSALGPIPVVFVEDLKDEKGRPIFGCWMADERLIKLCAGMHAVTTHTTFWYERIHQMCEDAGIHIGAKRQERVCDAISSALVAELLASPGRVG